ncbi:MAG: DUF1622 domain-containing protein [Chthoniobacteraceae bacterium]
MSIANVQGSASGLPGEETVRFFVQWVRLAIETIGAVIVIIGVVLALLGLLRMLRKKEGATFNSVRLTLASYLALALEFQLGADILTTAISPTWQQIGQLAAIAVIRTALNYFLSIEMDRERRAQEEEKVIHGDP